MIMEKCPDVVLLDMIMPHVDGLGVLERVNDSKLEKRPLFIMLSAVGQDKITQKAISLGAQYYIVKPFEIKLLIKRIKDTKPQYKLTRKERLVNLAEAYEVYKSKDLGMPVLILDDICTTGTTFEEMIKCLKM